jgi:DNA-binding NarL/FixJ family response regulator
MTRSFVTNDDTAPTAIGRKRVSVYASDPLTAAGVSALLIGRPDLFVLPRNRELEADVVIVAVDTVTVDFIDTLRQMSGRTGGRFVVILEDQWASDLFTAAELGIDAVIPRAEVSADRLSRAITTICRGGAELPADIQGRLLAQIRQLRRDVLQPRGLNAHGLDDREVDVLRLLASGFSIPEIADKVSYSERTVKNILHALISRLGMRNRTQTVAYAIRAGVI